MQVHIHDILFSGVVNDYIRMRAFFQTHAGQCTCNIHICSDVGLDGNASANTSQHIHTMFFLLTSALGQCTCIIHIIMLALMIMPQPYTSQHTSQYRTFFAQTDACQCTRLVEMGRCLPPHFWQREEVSNSIALWYTTCI